MAKNAKGNKTAHVLNLLTAPGSKEAAPADEPSTEGGVPETPAAEGAVSEAPAAVSSRPLLPPILEVAQANDDNLARQIQQALEDEYQADAPAQEEKPSEPPAAASAPAGGKMSQEDIEKLLAGAADTPVQAEKPAESPAAASAPAGGKMSQEDIEKLLAGAASVPAQEEKPAEPPAASSAPAGGKMSQEDIEKLLAGTSDTPAQEEKPAEPPAAAPSGGKMSQEDIEKLLAGTSDTPAQEEKPAEAPVEEPAPPPQPEPAPTPEEDPYNDLTYINVMQTLVEEKAPRYIEMFGLCPCKRCATDVVALTLNNLVPKYVVMTKQDMIPMLTVYEGRFNSTIFAQLTRACKTVMDNPRHDPGHSK